MASALDELDTAPDPSQAANRRDFANAQVNPDPYGDSFFHQPGITADNFPAPELNRRQLAEDRLRAEDLRSRGVPTYRDDTTGRTAAVTDDSGAPLTGYNRAASIAYDSQGQPKKISYGETGGPKLSDPFETIPSRVDPATGAIEKYGPAGLYKYEGQDPTVTAQVAQKQKDVNIAKESALLGRKLTLDEHDVHQGEADIKTLQATLIDKVPILSDPKFQDADQPTVMKAIDGYFNTQYAAADANETSGWFGDELTPEAKARRAQIDSDKAAAYQHAQDLAATTQQVSSLNDSVAASRQQERAQVETLLAHQRGEKGPLDQPQGGAAGGGGGGGGAEAAQLYPPQAHWADILGSQQAADAMVAEDQARQTGTKAAVQMPGVAPTPVDKLNDPFGADDPRSYRIGEDKSFHLDPNNLMKGLRQGIEDGVIDPEKAKAMTPQLRELQDAVNAQREVIDAAGGYSKVKATIHGAGMGAAFAAGAAPGAAAGTEVGEAITAATGGTGAIAIPAGAIIGGMVGGSISAYGAKKLVDKLAESNDTIRSITASAEMHPYYDLAGNVASFGIGTPTKLAEMGVNLAEKTGSKAAQSIAKSYLESSGGLYRTISNLAEDAAIRKAGGASAGTVASAITARVAGAAATNLAIDTVLNEGAKALGWQKEGETLPSATAAMLIGSFASAHGISFKDYNPSAMADILMRAKGAMDTGKDINTVLTKAETEAFNAFGTELRRKINTGEIPLDSDAITGTVRQALQGGKPYGVSAADILGKGGTKGLGEGPGAPVAPPDTGPKTSPGPQPKEKPADVTEVLTPAEVDKQIKQEMKRLNYSEQDVKDLHPGLKGEELLGELRGAEPSEEAAPGYSFSPQVERQLKKQWDGMDPADRKAVAEKAGAPDLHDKGWDDLEPAQKKAIVDAQGVEGVEPPAAKPAAKPAKAPGMTIVEAEKAFIDKGGHPDKLEGEFKLEKLRKQYPNPADRVRAIQKHLGIEPSAPATKPAAPAKGAAEPAPTLDHGKMIDATKGMMVGDQPLHEWGREQLAKNPDRTAFAHALREHFPEFDFNTAKGLADALKAEKPAAPAPAPKPEGPPTKVQPGEFPKPGYTATDEKPAAPTTGVPTSEEIRASGKTIVFDKTANEPKFVDPDHKSTKSFMDTAVARVVEKGGKHFALPTGVHAETTTKPHLSALLDVENHTADPVLLRPKDITSLTPAEVRPKGNGEWEVVKKGSVVYGNKSATPPAPPPAPAPTPPAKPEPKPPAPAPAPAPPKIDPAKKAAQLRDDANNDFPTKIKEPARLGDTIHYVDADGNVQKAVVGSVMHGMAGSVEKTVYRAKDQPEGKDIRHPHIVKVEKGPNWPAAEKPVVEPEKKPEITPGEEPKPPEKPAEEPVSGPPAPTPKPEAGEPTGGGLAPKGDTVPAPKRPWTEDRVREQLANSPAMRGAFARGLTLQEKPIGGGGMAADVRNNSFLIDVKATAEHEALIDANGGDGELHLELGVNEELVRLDDIRASGRDFEKIHKAMYNANPAIDGLNVWWPGSAPWMMSAEWVRMLVQLRTLGKITEQSFGPGGQAVGYRIDKLLELLKQEQAPIIERHVKKMMNLDPGKGLSQGPKPPEIPPPKPAPAPAPKPEPPPAPPEAPKPPAKPPTAAKPLDDATGKALDDALEGLFTAKREPVGLTEVLKKLGGAEPAQEFLEPGPYGDAEISVPGMWEHDSDYLTAHTTQGRVEIRDTETAGKYSIVVDGEHAHGEFSLQDAVELVEESYMPLRRPPGLLRAADLSDQKAIPAEKMGGFIAAAQALLKAGIDTPEALAATLEDRYKGQARPFSQGLWDMIGVVNPALRGTHDWPTIYANLAKKQEEPEKPPGKVLTPQQVVTKAVANKLRLGQTVDRRTLTELAKGNGLETKEADEAAEMAVVQVAREIVAMGQPGTEGWQVAANDLKARQEKFDQLVDLYNRQPNLTAKTSASKVDQAYSTPVPLAFAASQLADMTVTDRRGRTVYEPTAGNGMLLIEAKPHMTLANEMDPARAANLESLGFSVTTNDATEYAPEKGMLERVLANPPFGRILTADQTTKTWPLTGTNDTTHEIDHAIALKSLSSLNDDGRAVLILGGKNPMLSGPDRAAAYAMGDGGKFWKALYNQYQVVDHFTVNGDLYKKQGAGWPVDVVVIAGRGQSQIQLPWGKAPRILGSWDELRNELGRTDAERIDAGKYDAEKDRAEVERIFDDIRDVAGAHGKPGPSESGEPTGSKTKPGGTGGGPVTAPGGEPAPPAVEPPAGSHEPPAGGAGAVGPGADTGGPVEQQQPVALDPELNKLFDDLSEGLFVAKRDPNLLRTAEASGPLKWEEQADPTGAYRVLEATMPSGDVARIIHDTRPDKGEFPVHLTFVSSKVDTDPATDFLGNFRTVDEAKAKAQEFVPNGQKVIPPDRLPALVVLAKALIQRGVTTPEKLAWILEDKFQGRARPFSQSIWDMIGAQEPSLRGTHDWNEIYAKMDQARTTIDPESFRVKYVPQNDQPSFGVFIPTYLEAPVREALEKLKAEIGPLDEYVRKQLGYSDKAPIGKYFSAEQIDHLAPAIYAIENGLASINGDQGGLGKGRVAAGMMAYALKKGWIPVFVTQDEKLYAEMIKDLRNIGRDDIVPMFTNSDINFEDETGANWRQKKARPLMEQIIADGALPMGIKAIFTSYAQIGSDAPPGWAKSAEGKAHAKGANITKPPGFRVRALQKIAPKSLIIADESHLASGQSIAGNRLHELMGNAKGVYYSSATFAKRADSMGIYTYTTLSHATTDMQELIDAMKQGGTPIQQVVSHILASDGLYNRLERDFAGVVFKSHINEDTAERDRKLADNYTAGLREILDISNTMQATVRQFNQIMQRLGKRYSLKYAPKIESTNFSSKLHNCIKQYLFAIKAESLVQRAIVGVKDGFTNAKGETAPHKVVITFENTMEGPILDLKASKHPLSFQGMLLHYLDKQRILKPKGGTGGTEDPMIISDTPDPNFAHLSNDQLAGLLIDDVQTNPEGQRVGNVNEAVATELFRRIMAEAFAIAEEKIKALDLADMPLSPIDYMKHRLAAEGIRTGEMTGREAGIDQDGVYYEMKAPTKREHLQTIRAFNNTDMHVLLMNASGSTGISLHSSVEFKGEFGQMPRSMLIGQANLDINKFMQTLWRIDRTGQVHQPYYEQVLSSLAAELRPAAINSKKMASLNANTTSNAQSEVSKGASGVNIFNQYGDEVIHDYLKADKDFLTLLALDKILDQKGVLYPLDAIKQIYPEEGKFAQAITGRVGVMPEYDARAFWDKITTDYNALIAYLTAIGENELMTDTIDLKAETIASKELTSGRPNPTSGFDGPSHLEKIRANIGKKPLPATEVIGMMEKLNQWETMDKWRAAATEWKKKELARQIEKAVTWKPEKEKALEEKWREAEQTIHNSLAMIGSGLHITTRRGVDGYGAITALHLDLEHPLVPSKQMFEVHVNTSRQKIKIAASQLSNEARHAASDFASVYEATAERSNERYMITGNLLKAYLAIKDSTPTAKIVNYTTSAGDLRQGILMPVKFDPGQLATKRAVDDANHFKQLLDANRSVNAAGDIISMVKAPSGPGYVMRVPSSKIIGGAYWRDPVLQALMDQTGGKFNERGNAMVGRFTDTKAVYDRLTEMGAGITYREQTQNLQVGKFNPIKSLYEKDVEPVAKNVGLSVKEALQLVRKLVSPRSGVQTPGLDAVMKALGTQYEKAYQTDRVLEAWNGAVQKMPRDEQVAFVDRVKRGEPQPTPELQALADTERAIDTESWRAANAAWADWYKALGRPKAEPPLNWKEDHFRVLWKVIPGSTDAEKAAWIGRSRSPLRGSMGQHKQSTLSDMSEGLARGGVPYTYNHVEMFKRAQVDLWKTTTILHLLAFLKNNGMMEYVKGPFPKAPEGFVAVDDSAFRKYFPAASGEGLVSAGQYFVEEGVGRLLNNYLSKDLIRQVGVGRGLIWLKNASTAMELSLSPFHAIFVALETVGSNIGLALEKLVNRGILGGSAKVVVQSLLDMIKAPFTPATQANLGAQFLKALADPTAFFKTPEGAKMLKAFPIAREAADAIFAAGFKPAQLEQDWRNNSIRTFVDALSDIKAGASDNYIGAALRAFPAANEMLMKPLFDHLIPNLKIGQFLKEFSEAVAEDEARYGAHGYHIDRSGKKWYRPYTRPELARKIWDFVEDRFGEMNYDKIFWNRTFKSAMQLMFRSVTWKGGSIRAFGNAFTGQGKEFINAFREKRAPELHRNMAWLFGMALLTAALGTIISTVLGGKKPKTLTDLVFPQIDPKDPSIRISLPTYFKDMIHLLHDPASYVTSSMAGWIGRVMDLMRNKDYYGVQIHNSDDPATKQALDIGKYAAGSLLPFSIRGYKNLSDQDVTGLRKALALMGANPAPRYISQTDAEKAGEKYWKGRSTDEGISPEQMESNKDKRKMVAQIRRGESPNISGALEKGVIKPRDIKPLYKRAAMGPLAAMVLHMPLVDAEKLYKKATPAEKAQLAGLMASKRANSVSRATSTGARSRRPRTMFSGF